MNHRLAPLVLRVMLSLMLVAGVLVPQAFPEWVVMVSMRCFIGENPITCAAGSTICDVASITCTRCNGNAWVDDMCIHALNCSCLSGGTVDCGDMWLGTCNVMGVCVGGKKINNNCSVASPCNRIPPC